MNQSQPTSNKSQCHPEHVNTLSLPQHCPLATGVAKKVWAKNKKELDE